MEVNKVVKCDSNYSKCGQLDPFATQSEEEKSNCTKFLRKKQQRSYNVVKESLRRNMESGLNNGRWTLEEHKRFIQGVLEFGNRWRYVAKVIETRNSAQIRSHCQKFFSKLHNLGIEGISNNITDVNYLHDLALTLEPNDLSQLIIQLTDVAFNKLEKLDNKKQDQKKDPIILKIEVQESENKERESRLETEKRFTENFSLGRSKIF
jgi:SHAQKYF class myb-like DNA-binding protein